MSFENWPAVAAAVVLSAFVGLFATSLPASPAPIQPHSAGLATLGTIPDGALPSLPLPNLVAPTTQAPPSTTTSPAAAVTSATPAQTKPTSPTATPAAPAPAKPATMPAPATQAATTPAQATTSATAPQNAGTASPTTSALNSTIGLLQGALVNIICVPQAPNLKAASASGVLIDSRGIVMTVAHMAQYFLLADYPSHGDTRCIIRTGSPASGSYTAQLIYISPEWIKANPTTLVESVPTGTGENDFAFLAITGSASGTALPSSFPVIPLSHADPTTGESVSIGSYGAEFLDAQEIESSLYPIIVFGSITDRFTFAVSTPDLISVENTAAAQEGSSGGVVIGTDNTIAGLITTSSLGSTNVTQRTLHAITPNYIRRAFQADTGKSLDSFLSGSTLPALIQSFASQSSGLSSFLESKLD